ncbi:hypothetical protein QUA27_00165 [Microcoleus sp. Pol14C6]|uniref:hypothetical protein n=1 Tax=unclassified Microcoleus TaxID=2642155 RepID=UPI002FD32A88
MGDRQWTGFEDLRYYKLNDNNLNGHDISHRPVNISTIPVQFQPIAIESPTALILVGCDRLFLC